MKAESMIRYDRKDRVTGDMVRFYQHPSGFRIDLVQKKNYASKYAGILLPFGFEHLRFKDSEDTWAQEVPAPCPFITQESLLAFQGEEGPVAKIKQFGIQLESKLVHQNTVYSFSTVEHYLDAVLELVNLVLFQDFDEATVKAQIEKMLTEVVLEEEDDIQVAKQLLLDALYQNPLLSLRAKPKLEDLENLQFEEVYQYYRRAYHPSNLTLVLLGDFSPEVEENMIDQLSKKLDCLHQSSWEAFLTMHSSFEYPSDYGQAVKEKEVEVSLPSTRSAFYLSYKKAFPDGPSRRGGRAIMRSRLAGTYLLNMLIGKGSETFESLYSAGLIDDSFTLRYVLEEGYAHLYISGDSNQPEEAIRHLSESLESKIAEGAFDEKRIDEIARASIGEFLISLDDIKQCGNMVVDIKTVNLEFSDYASIFLQHKSEELLEELQFVKRDNRAFVIVHGRNKRS